MTGRPQLRSGRRSGQGAALVAGLMLLAGCAAGTTPPGSVTAVGTTTGPRAPADRSTSDEVLTSVSAAPSPGVGTSDAASPGVGTSDAAPPQTSVSGGVDEKVGLESNGQVVDLVPGQQLEVALAADWTAPRAAVAGTIESPGLSPLRLLSSVGFPAAGAARSRFLAARVGTAMVTAYTDYRCLHSTPRCALPQQLFTLTVRVRPVAGIGPLPVSPAG